MTRCPALLLIPLWLLALPAMAQHPRLLDTPANTGTPTAAHAAAGAMAAHTTEVPADTALPVPAPPPRAIPAGLDRNVGDATRRLLQLQASGVAAAPALPQLGQPAGAAWQRYLQSFAHPIPQFFDSTVPSGTGGGSGR